MDVVVVDDDDDAAAAFSMERVRQNDYRLLQNGNAASSSFPHQQQHRQQQEHQRLQRRFEKLINIRPSSCWLEQCLVHLRSSANAPRAGVLGHEEEEIWNQILQSDLRDVVREYEPSSGTNDAKNNDNAERGGAAMQLRNAINQSKNSGSNIPNRNGKYQSGKAILPSNFRLLIQMEEVIDVTMTCEQRLAAMGGGPSAAAAAEAVSSNAYNRYNDNTDSGQQHHGGTTRNSRHRCLKMTFSDGYYPNGVTFPQQDDDGKENNIIHVLMAIETSQILNLSVSSPPGLKLLLHGPIIVRVGLVELNDGNCAVIGGEIDSWKEVWKKAKERAQREKGLGIDPTVKALVWNPLMGDEEELDEGEGESGDATVVVVPQPPPMLQAPRPLPPTQPVITPNQPTTTTNPNSAIHASCQHHRNQTLPTAANASTSATASRALDGGNSRQRTLDFYPKKPRPETTRLMPNNKNNASTSSGNSNRPVAAQQQQHANPYQRTNDNIGGKNAHPQNPPPLSSQNETNIIPFDDSPPRATFRKSTEQPLSNPYASLRPSNSAPFISITTQPTSVSASATNAGTYVPSTFTSNPSFLELKLILQELRTNRALYEQYYDRIITVPCKMEDSGSKDKVFNIVKAPPVAIDESGSGKKKGKSKKEKKYEFFFVGKFFGPKHSDGAIACRVESSLIAPYFDVYSPAEIRKLTREDKDRVNRIINQCMSQCIHEFSSLGQFQMKLMFTADEFTAETSSLSSNDWLADTAHPFLLVVKKV